MVGAGLRPQRFRSRTQLLATTLLLCLGACAVVFGITPQRVSAWLLAGTASRGVGAAGGATTVASSSVVVRRAGAQMEVPGDLKKNLKIEIEGAPYELLSYESKKVGKGVAVTKTIVRNLITGATVDKTLQSGKKYDIIETTWNTATYSYLNEADDTYVFMDTETFEELLVQRDIIGELGNWIEEGSIMDIEFYKGQIISTQLKGEIIKTIKSVTQVKQSGKDITVILSNELTRQAPSFCAVGDKVLIDPKNFVILKRL